MTRFTDKNKSLEEKLKQAETFSKTLVADQNNKNENHAYLLFINMCSWKVAICASVSLRLLRATCYMLCQTRAKTQQFTVDPKFNKSLTALRGYLDHPKSKKCKHA